MGKYFGTDGIRGIANEKLSLEIAFRMGSFLAYYYTKENGRNAKIAIAKDTRLSSSMYESMLASAISAYGGDAYLIGYTSTPNLAYIVSSDEFDLGIMISASHNPYYDNGLKVFTPNGLKLDNKIELLIEEYIDHPYDLGLKTYGDIGHIYDYSCGITKYLNWLDKMFDYDLSDMTIALDLANGSSTYTAQKAFENKNANLFIINNEPNGININNECGSTHLEALINFIKNHKVDIGFAFDGDADRVLCINSKGEIIDGDKIMYLLSKHLKAHHQLKDNTLVTTVMSNIGLFKALNRVSIDYKVVSVGDKNVTELMNRKGYVIGGEQSGHIINANHGLFGDGLKTAMNILEVIKETGKDIDTLLEDVHIYPQLLVNVKVNDKEETLKDETILKLIKDIENELGDDGRILVRPSGTEPLVRVMVEASDDQTCHRLVYRVIEEIKNKGYAKV